MTAEEMIAFAESYFVAAADGVLDTHQECIDELIKNEPEVALRLLIIMVDRSPGLYISQIGAGPLEDLVYEHPHFLERMLRVAQRDVKFREAFRYIRGMAIPPSLREAYDDLWRQE